MTVSHSNAFSGPFAGNGSTTAFPFTFDALEAEEVKASVDGAEVSDGYEVTLSDSGGGTLTFTTAPASGTEIFVYSEPTFLQSVEFENAGAFLPRSHDDVADRQAILSIYLKNRADRSLRAPIGETLSDMPASADRLGMYLKFNASTGQPEVDDARGPKGDPGGNAASIGTFASASSQAMPVAVKIVQTTGTATDGDLGAGRQFIEDSGVDAAFVTANPLISFRDTGGRGFREIDPRTGEKIEPFLIVIAGQSNALGANSGGPNPASPGVKTWNANSGAWGGSDYTAAPWTLASPNGNAGNNNYALAAAHRIYAETRRPVYIVLDAAGGTSIDAWVASGTSSTRYAALKDKIEDALATVQFTTHSKTSIDALIWAQGEEDSAADGFATYLANLGTLDTQLRAESWMDEFTPAFIMGMSGLHERYEVASALRHFCRYSKGTWRYISSRGLKTLFDATAAGDFTHFLGNDLWSGGYDRLAPAIIGASIFSEHVQEMPFYGRGAGKLTQSDATAIATFDNLVNWTSRTDGPAVTDDFTGDGSTTVFTLTGRGTIASVTVAGVAKTNPTDYSVVGQTLTFVTAPASLAAIVVSYGLAVSGPSAVGSMSWGYRCYADANYSFAFGYQNYTDGLARYAMAGGRETSLNSGADYSFAWGLQHTLSNTYQFAAGRGHTLTASGQAAFGIYSKYTDGSRSFQFGIGVSAGTRKNALAINAAQGNVELYAPSTAVDPGNNEEITFKLTSTTNLRIVAKCSDGTVRVANITLA